MNNYPDDVNPKDPRAPWNQPNVEMIDCPDCNGTGVVASDDEENEFDDCETCKGEGEIEDDESDEFPEEGFF